MGKAGFVLPFRRNVVFVEIEQGDDFGQIDILSSAHDNHVELIEIINQTELL